MCPIEAIWTQISHSFGRVYLNTAQTFSKRLSAGRLNGFSGDAHGDKSINPSPRLELDLGHSYLLCFFWFALRLHWFSQEGNFGPSSPLDFFETS